MSDGFVSYTEQLKRDGFFLQTTHGYSMYPMLRDTSDIIKIVPQSGKLKKYDVALYKRKSDGAMILHRVYKVGETDYVFIGDNCFLLEEGITDEDIVGVLHSFVRGNRKGKTSKPILTSSKRFKLYSRLRCGSLPLMRFTNKIIRVAAKLTRRLRKRKD